MTNLTDLTVDSLTATSVAASALTIGGMAQASVKGGSSTAVAGDDTAGYKDIATGLTSITTFVVQILRSGVPIASDQVYTATGGTLRVADGGATYAVTAGDVFKWIAVGA